MILSSTFIFCGRKFRLQSSAPRPFKFSNFAIAFLSAHPLHSVISTCFYTNPPPASIPLSNWSWSENDRLLQSGGYRKRLQPAISSQFYPAC
jgi:hypothetical protein